MAIGTVVLTFVLTGGTAFAYHCYNASLSDQGRAQMGNSAAFYTVKGVLVDLCGIEEHTADAIIQTLITDYDSGYEYDPVLISNVEISIVAHMAGGFEMWHSPNAEELWHDGKGIDHLGPDLETVSADLIAAAASEGIDLNACG